MTVKIFDTPEVQTFLNAVAGLDQAGGNDRAKQIVHRLVGDLFKLIDDFDVSEEEYWAAVNRSQHTAASGEVGRENTSC